MKLKNYNEWCGEDKGQGDYAQFEKRYAAWQAYLRDQWPAELLELHEILVAGRDEFAVHTAPEETWVDESENRLNGNWTCGSNYEDRDFCFVLKEDGTWWTRTAWSGEDHPIMGGFEAVKNMARVFWM